MVDMEDAACDLLVAALWINVIEIQLAQTFGVNPLQGQCSCAV